MEVYFNIKGKHESSTGHAVVVSDYDSGYSDAISHFDEGDVKCNQLGVMATPEGDYKIYEAYVDSGSDDYYYFAIAQS